MTGLTWVNQLIPMWKMYLEEWLKKLDQESHVKRPDFKKIENLSEKGFSTSTRDDLLKFFGDQLGLMTISNPNKNKKDHIFNITEIGNDILYQDKTENKDLKLHYLLYKNIFHYKFSFQLIIKNQFYNISFTDFMDRLIQASLNILGFPIYDRHSFDNIKYIIYGLSSIYYVCETNKHFSLSNNLKIQFKEDQFIEMVKKLLYNKEMVYTYYLCEQLNKEEIKSNYLTGNYEIFDEKIIFEKLKDLNIIKFKGGIPRKFIPAIFTLVQLK